MSELPVYAMKSKSDWQKLLEETQSVLGMPTALLDPDNVILQSSGERNELCREIRSKDSAKPLICGQSQKFMAEMARTKKSSVVELCEGGMAKLVVPIFRAQDYLGSITACGAMLPETEIEAFLIQKTAEIDEAAIDEMVKTIPPTTEELLQQVADDLFRRAND